jgi:hypothetical protein
LLNAGDIEGLEADTAPLERGEERLLPFRVLVQDDEVGWGGGGHFDADATLNVMAANPG